MTYINGYKYINEQEAINARQKCNDYYRIPISLDSTTQNWTDYYYTELNEQTFYYIIFDESLIPILGQPIEFEVEISI